MIRALPFLVFLTACAEFPLVDAAAPTSRAPRPSYLTPSELAAVNALQQSPATATATADGAALRARAADLRARQP